MSFLGRTVLSLLCAVLLLQIGASAIQVTLNTPAQDNVRMYCQYNFSATVVTTAGEEVTSVQIQNGTGGNWIAMTLTEGTNQSGNWSVVLDLTTMPDGPRVFTYNATNGTTYNDTTTVTAIIDNTPPSSITITAPANDSWTTSSTVLYNFTAVDVLASNLTCNVTENGAVIYSNTSVLNNTPTVFTLSKSENDYTFNITCWDNAVSNVLGGSGNQNISETVTFHVDWTPPAVAQLSPVDNYNTSSAVNSITINVTDNLSPNATCYVYVDGSQGNGGTVPLPQTSLGISQLFSEGKHQYYVNCTDAAGNFNTTSIRTITVDQTPPTVTINSPVNYYNTSSAANLINFTFTDALSPTASCVLYVDGVSTASGTEQNNTPAVYSTGSLTEGEHTYYVNCTDNVGNIGQSASQVIRVDLTPPIVNLMSGSPVNDTNTTSTTLSVQFNFTDTMSVPGSCYLYVDGAIVAQNTSATNNTPTTLSVTGLAEGTHYWYVNCSDQVGWWNVSETRTYNIDLTNPQFAGQVYPTVPNWIITGNSYVYGNFSDYFTGIAGVNFALMSSGVNVTPWTAMSLYSGNLTQGVWRGLLASASVADGMYAIQFNITDQAGNYNDTTGVQPVYVDNNPPVIAWETPANNSAFNQYTSYVTVVVNATDAGTSISSATVSAPNGTTDFSQATSCTKSGSAPGVIVCNFHWNLSGLPDGAYSLTFSAGDQAGWSSDSTINVTVDNTPPAVSFGAVTNAVQINGRWYTTAGEAITVPVTVTDATSGVNTTVVSVIDMTNTTVYSCTGTSPVNCQFTPSQSGVYTFAVRANDSAGNINAGQYLTVYVVNGLPKQSYDSSKITLQDANLTTLRSEYSVPVPIYREDDESFLEGFWVDPVYTDKPVFAGATSMENLAYNYTFQLNASNLAASNEIVTITLTTPGLIPAKVSTQTIYTPAGPVNLTLIAPDALPGQYGFSNLFTIEYNGTKYANTGDLASQPINGSFSFDFASGKTVITLQVNATNQTVVPVTLYLSAIPPINVSSQTVTGFDPTTAPPELGATVNTTYTVNISALNQFYTQDNVYLDFVFPKNVTVSLPDGTVKTLNISSGVTLQEWNGTAWAAPNATRTSAYSACYNVTDAISGSPTHGANITVCFSVYRYKITVAVVNHTDLPDAWLAGKTFVLKANALLSFPAIEEVVPQGTAGDNNYSATINMAQQGNIKLTNDDVPGITNADQIEILVDGAPWQGTYKKGSLILLDGTLSPGVHNIKVNYHIPSTTTTTTAGGLAGGSVPTGSVTMEGEPEPVQEYKSAEEVVQEITSDESLKKALEDVLGEQLTEDALNRLAEQSYKYAGDFTHTASMISSTSASTLKVTLKYTGTETLHNVVVYDEVPKDFAANASEITVNAPGATVRVVREDPVFMLVYDQVNPGDELTVEYQTSGWKNLNIVEEKPASKVFVAGTAPTEEQPAAPAPEEQAPEEKPAEEQQPAAPSAPQAPTKPAQEVTPTAQDYTWVLVAGVVAIVAVLLSAVLYWKQKRTPPISGAGKKMTRRK